MSRAESAGFGVVCGLPNDWLKASRLQALRSFRNIKRYISILLYATSTAVPAETKRCQNQPHLNCSQHGVIFLLLPFIPSNLVHFAYSNWTNHSSSQLWLPEIILWCNSICIISFSAKPSIIISLKVRAGIWLKRNCVYIVIHILKITAIFISPLYFLLIWISLFVFMV